MLLVLFFSSTEPRVGREEHLQNDLFCVEWDVKPYSVSQCRVHQYVSLHCLWVVKPGVTDHLGQGRESTSTVMQLSC